jgi:pimeloyl-ACP methyl ester carboxylesterase
MYFSVQCGEELPFTSLDAAVAAAGANPGLAQYSEYEARAIFAACGEWEARPAAGRENEAVTSEISALVLAGQFDPITPPAWGRLAAESLSGSFYFEFPGVGHGVALGNECGQEIASDFLNDPRQQPPGGCIDELGGPGWLTGG